jgi:hypothetical protein
MRASNSFAMSWHFRQLPFWDRVHTQTERKGECIEFTGHKDECGYGRIRSESGRLVRVHRAVYEKSHGEIPPGMVVMHSCDNPACINLNHLKAGTQPENIKDMDRKGRRISLVGTQQSQAKVNEADVKEIRARLVNETCASIARDYRVSEALIRNIKKNRRWTHVQ